MIVRLEFVDGSCVLKELGGRTTSEDHLRYRAAIRGAAWDGRLRCLRAPVDAVPDILERLCALEMVTVEISVEVADRVGGLVDDLRADVAQAEARAFGSDTLYPYQQEGAVKLASRRRFLLADSPGLGKTRQGIMAVPENAPVLVVCPALAKKVWQKEFSRVRPDFVVDILEGVGSFRWPRSGEVLAINPDILPEAPMLPCVLTHCTKKRERGSLVCREHRNRAPFALPDRCVVCDHVLHPDRDCLEVMLGEDAPPGMVVIADEAHLFKEEKSARTQEFRRISRTARMRNGHVWLLTGTPILGKPPELWAVLMAADLAYEAFGDWDNFVRIFGGKVGRFNNIEWPDYRVREVPEEAMQCLADVMLRRRREEVLPDLPRKAYDDIFVDLTAQAQKEADKQVRELEAAHIYVNDPLFLEKVPFEKIARLRAMMAKVKIPSMTEFVESYEAQDEPLVVFSAHLAPIEKLGRRKGWRVITGATHPDDRFEICEMFQKGYLKGVGGSIDAAGVAITLVHACHALFVDLEWTPALNEQAEDRICRIGQTRPVMIHRLIGDHLLERRVADILTKKTALIEKSVNKAPVRSFVDVSKLNLRSMVVDRPPMFLPPGALAERRGPRDTVEAWAAKSITLIASFDARRDSLLLPDDMAYGHSLASQVELGLSNEQWRGLVAMLPKYWRFIGVPPKRQPIDPGTFSVKTGVRA